MKKYAIALALSLAMLGSLASCGADRDPGTNNGSATGGTGSGSAGQVTRRYGASGREPAYNSYLDDGRYAAGSNGQVYSRGGDMSRDLTQGARDIVRGAEDAAEDIGRSIGSAARDITNSGTPSWEPDSSARS